jgi:hypothetical protein
LEKKVKMGCARIPLMKYLLVFLVLGLLFAGCPQNGAAGGAPEAETIGQEPAPAGVAGEAAPAEVSPEPEAAAPEPEPEVEQEPEVEEDELLRWDVGVTEEISEEHRKLQAVEFDNYVLIVDDITDDYPYPCAALRVGDMSGEYIETLFQDKVCPGESTYWVSPEGGKYRIKVFETAAGYGGFAYWADVAVYKQR